MRKWENEKKRKSQNVNFREKLKYNKNINQTLFGFKEIKFDLFSFKSSFDFLFGCFLRRFFSSYNLSEHFGQSKHFIFLSKPMTIWDSNCFSKHWNCCSSCNFWDNQRSPFWPDWVSLRTLENVFPNKITHESHFAKNFILQIHHIFLCWTNTFISITLISLWKCSHWNSQLCFCFKIFCDPNYRNCNGNRLFFRFSKISSVSAEDYHNRFAFLPNWNHTQFYFWFCCFCC